MNENDQNYIVTNKILIKKGEEIWQVKGMGLHDSIRIKLIGTLSSNRIFSFTGLNVSMFVNHEYFIGHEVFKYLDEVFAYYANDK